MKIRLILITCLFPFFATLSRATICVDFESLPRGSTYPVGSVIEENTVPMFIVPGIDENGQQVVNGFARIIEDPPGGGNQALLLNNSAVCLELSCGDMISFTFQNSGGYVNLSIDGDDLQLAGLGNGSFVLGGTTVTVTGALVQISSLTSAAHLLCIGGQELRVDNICFETCDSGDCLDFESLGPDRLFSGDSFSEDGRTIEVIGFDKNLGSLAGADTNNAGHRGREIDVSVAGIQLRDLCASSLEFKIAQSQDGIEININGDSLLLDTIDAFDGLEIGGVVISVIVKDDGGVLRGTVSLEGAIESFSISGQRFSLDHLCLGKCDRNCIDFEGEPVGTTFQKGEVFMEDGYAFTFLEYRGISGEGVISDLGKAGFAGQDMWLFRATMAGRFDCMEAFSFHFGQYADGILITINGETVSVEDLRELHAAEVGGVILSVSFDLVNGGVRGVLEGTGTFDELAIGGTDLYIDHLCLTPCPKPGCIEFEAMRLGAVFRDGDILSEDGTDMEVFPFGQGLEGVTITEGNFANGFGNEATLENAGLRLRYACASSVVFDYAYFSGLVQVSINGSDSLPVAGFSSLDGAVVGGATLSVTGTHAGTVTATGTILEIAIAGDELALDNICRTTCPPSGTCLDFEALPPSGTWTLGTGFTEDGVEVECDLLFDSAGQLVSIDPLLRVDNRQLAGHLGNDLRMINAFADFDFGQSCVTNLSLHFGDYGSIVSVSVNGDTEVVQDLSGLDGASIGGTTLSVIGLPVSGGQSGLLSVEGNVTRFAIGGQNLFVDRICFTVCDPIFLGQLRLIDVRVLKPNLRQYTMQVPMTGPGTLRLRGNQTLGLTWPLQSGAVITPLTGQPDLFEIKVTKPVSDDRWFFRAEAVY